MSLFVSLAAFCEPWLEFTLDGLFGQAAQPEAIHVGLVDQSIGRNREWLAAKPYWPNIRYVHLDPIDSNGVSWARGIAFSLSRGETYLLQIDSHTHFAADWDVRLIDSLETLRMLVERPILTTYPPAFEFDADSRPFPTQPPGPTVYGLHRRPGSELSDSCATLSFEVEHLHDAEYVEGHHVGAGFLFTLGQFVDEVPYDPYLYFHGEEQSLAIRAYTRGWTILHPQHQRIPLYHLYKAPNQPHLTHHWHADYEAQRQVKRTELQQRSDARLLALVSGRLKGAYGLGTVRSLDEFARISGIDYRRYWPKASSGSGQ